MSTENMASSGALIEVAGSLRDLAEKLEGDQGSQWLEEFKKFLGKEGPWPWRIIKLGPGLKTAEDFYEALRVSGRYIAKQTKDLMSQPIYIQSLTEADPEQEYDLIVVTADQLTGNRKYANILEIFACAKRLGFEKCPAWLGPKLAMDYKDQPLNQRLYVGMDPIMDSDGSLAVFTVECSGTGPPAWTPEYWLHCGTIYGGSSFGFPSSDVVLCHPRKKS